MHGEWRNHIKYTTRGRKWVLSKVKGKGGRWAQTKRGEHEMQITLAHGDSNNKTTQEETEH